MILMFESTNTMIQLLSTNAGYVLPMSTQIDRTSRRAMHERWTEGLGGDIVATALSMAAILLIGLLA